MQNEEDMGLETIIKRNSDPSRSSKKGNIIVKAAKFTGRTFSSLNRKRKEHSLDRAFEKYNKKYAKMRIALKEANELKQEKQEGANISNQEVVDAYDKVVSYNKKIARYAVKLLALDIEELGRGNAIAQAKRIRVPRILIGRIRKVRRLCEKKALKKAARKETRKIKGTTKDYISTSIPKAIFEDAASGKLKDSIDKEKIQSMKMDDSRVSVEDRMANLKSFISVDGKTSLYPKTESVSTDVPPTEPESTVKKEDTKVTTEDILAGLNNGKKIEDETKKEPASQGQPRVTLDELMGALSSKPKKAEVTEDQPIDKTSEPLPTQPPVETEPTVEIDFTPEKEDSTSRIREDAHRINVMGAVMSSLESQIASAVDNPETMEIIRGYIDITKGEFEKIIDEDSKTRMTEENNVISKEPEVKEETVIAEEYKEEKPVFDSNPVEFTVDQTNETSDLKESLPLDPIIVEAPETVVTTVESEPTNDMNNVVVKDSEYMRVAQNSKPSGVRVTPEDILRITSETEKAQAQAKELDEVNKDLAEQKQLWQEYKAAVEASKATEQMLQEKMAMNAALTGEVDQLASQVPAPESGLGRAK